MHLVLLLKFDNDYLIRRVREYYCRVSLTKFMRDRYTLDVDLKTIVTADKLESTTSRVETRKVLFLTITTQSYSAAIVC